MLVPLSVSGSTFTANARFPFGNGQAVRFSSTIRNGLPAPLDSKTTYYVVNLSGSTFQVSATLNGAPVVLTAAPVGQIRVSEYPVLLWSQLVALPLVRPYDLRRVLLSPEAPLSLSAAPDTPIGLNVNANVFTTGIPHGLSDWTAIQFGTDGTLPNPIVAGTTYYARDTTSNTFTAASVIGGNAVNLTGSGSGQIYVQNAALNDVLASKITLGGEWLYEALLNTVVNHIKLVSASWWSWLSPENDFNLGGIYPLESLTSLDLAQIVLDNLLNPEQLITAWVEFALWAMIKDGSWRTQVGDAYQWRSPVVSPTAEQEKAAHRKLGVVAPLLMVSNQSTRRIFDFDQVTDSISISSF